MKFFFEFKDYKSSINWQNFTLELSKLMEHVDLTHNNARQIPKCTSHAIAPYSHHSIRSSQPKDIPILSKKTTM